jgi:hypothetical protein
MKFFRKYHKWLGIIVTLFILIFSFSGIILNHRNWFSNSNVKRAWLPESYQYVNWNNASIKSTLKLNADSILLYGNTGIWLTDSLQNQFSDFNQGLKKGIDNRKIYKIIKTDTHLLAGTLFGLFEYNYPLKIWQSIPGMKLEIMDISTQKDTILILTRSLLFKTSDLKNFTKIMLPEPIGYHNKVGLFKTLWVIHSGEIFGNIGKLLVDLMGLVFIVLCITGLIYFIAPSLMRFRRSRNLSNVPIAKANRFSLKWHNKLGWIFFPVLILITITGMFLRPPLLIAIYPTSVKKIPCTELNTPNAWFDKLRRVVYDENKNEFAFATIDGIYFINSDLSNKMTPAENQPPISVMGVNVFEKINSNLFLVGSFEGLFVWDRASGMVYDYVEKKPYFPISQKGSPIGNHMCAGFSNDFSMGPVYFDYNLGAIPLNSDQAFPSMPEILKNQPMSLWNFALELHTARIFDALIGSFYILIIPIIGLFTLFVLLSGFIVWYKIHLKSKK